jgi:O-acetylserine/cysteine efflux transporter
LQGVGQFGTLFLALKVGMPAALAPVVMQVQVFATSALAFFLLKERISRELQLGMLVAGSGLCCFVVNAMSASADTSLTFLGLMLNVVAATLWAGSNIVVRRLKIQGIEYDVLSLLVWSSLISAAGFLGLSWLFDPAATHVAWTQASLNGWLAVLYLGWGANLLAYWLWTSLLRRHPASRIAPFSLGIPVVGVLAGIALLGEAVTFWQWVGSALVMASLLLVIWPRQARG